MNISIPFKKSILFKSEIAEITSISLEHDVSINENELLGDFIIKGEYKNLEVNVDTMPFEHVIPFSVSLDDDILIDTLNYEVEDFTYDIENENILNVSIVFHVEAEKNTIDETIFKKEFDDEERNISNVILEEKKESSNDSLDNINILNNNIKEDYITYHIHIVKMNETMESIANEYKISKDKLIELNDITTIQVGDKLIIPELDE